MGIGSSAKGSQIKGRLIYAMQVQEKMTFDQYWNEPRFYYKRPVMNGSTRQMYGDNIYHTDENTCLFVQENSHHSLQDGLTNYDNFRRDLKTRYVLISRKYWYWGKDAILMPEEYNEVLPYGRGHKKVEDEILISEVVQWLELSERRGYIGEPIKFSGNFERYNGK